MLPAVMRNCPHERAPWLILSQVRLSLAPAVIKRCSIELRFLRTYRVEHAPARTAMNSCKAFTDNRLSH
jgi:hypothetical protein